MHYELKDLRLFLAITEAQNLSQGAAAMHMTASSASYHLKNLEYAVGSDLFVRTPKGMVLTAAGDVLVRHARKLLADVAVMHNELTDYSLHLRGSIKVLANSSSLNGFIIPSLGRFLAANSSINVDLHERESLSIVRMIENGEADIGVLAGDVSSASVHAEVYAVDRLVCAVPNDHPMAAMEKVSFLQTLENDFVCMASSSSNFVFLQQQARQTGRAMKTRVQVYDFHSVLALVEAGIGIAIVPASVAAARVQQQSISCVPVDEPWAVRNLHLIMHQSPAQPELSRQFADILLNDPHVVATRHTQ